MTSIGPSEQEIQVADFVDSCSVLGPGRRAVLWVQGCPLRCAGCISPQWLQFEGGETVKVEVLAQRILNLRFIEGVTFSGGEPFSQPSSLVALIDRVRLERDLSFMSYSGFTYEMLLAGSQPQRELLARLDILVDGPYIRSQHVDALWRASRNQTIRHLSDRHRARAVDHPSAGLEFEVHSDLSVTWTGVPSVPGFVGLLDRSLQIAHKEDSG